MRGRAVRAAVLFAAFACAQSVGAQAAEPFADGTWTLVKVVDAQGTVTPPVPAPTLTLTGTAVSMAEGTLVTGSAGCNTFTGRGVFTAKTVRLGPLATTRRACAPEVMALETRVLDVLGRARGLSFSAGTLVISTGTARLVYGQRSTAMDTRLRLQARWRLVGDTTDPAPTLEFGPDGRVSGETGCNRVTGTYTVTGDTLTLSPLATTRRACVSAALQAQETAFLTALAQVRTFTVSGARLTLVLTDGDRVTFARPVN